VGELTSSNLAVPTIFATSSIQNLITKAAEWGTIREHRRAKNIPNGPNPSVIGRDLSFIPSVTYIDSKPLS
jgi:hypothetical protein